MGLLVLEIMGTVGC